jgi:predicted transcriptional regulator
MTLIDALKKLRLQGKSQMWIAKQIGVEQSAVSRLENSGQVSIRFDAGIKLIELAKSERAANGTVKSHDSNALRPRTRKAVR